MKLRGTPDHLHVVKGFVTLLVMDITNKFSVFTTEADNLLSDRNGWGKIVLFCLLGSLLKEYFSRGVGSAGCAGLPEIIEFFANITTIGCIHEKTLFTTPEMMFFGYFR